MVLVLVHGVVFDKNNSMLQCVEGFGQASKMAIENIDIGRWCQRAQSLHIDGLVRDCSISSALAMEILQSCTEPLIFSWVYSSKATYTGVKQAIICKINMQTW